jgi:hypothetical protein
MISFALGVSVWMERVVWKVGAATHYGATRFPSWKENYRQQHAQARMEPSVIEVITALLVELWLRFIERNGSASFVRVQTKAA